MSQTPWYTVSGAGKFSSKVSSKLFGETSLHITANEKGVYSYAIFPQLVKIDKPSLAVLIWAGKNHTGQLKINHPEMAFLSEKFASPQQFALVELNDGIHATMKESNFLFASNWLLFSNVVPISPGTYSITLWLTVNPNESYAYDGFRFFILPLN